MLQFIQAVSLTLSAVSVLMLGGLILVHAVRWRWTSRKTRLASSLSRELIVWLDDPDASLAKVERAARHSPGLLTSVVLRMASQLRGEEHLRLIELASRMGLEERIVRDLARWHSGPRRRAAEQLALFKSDASAQALTAALNDRHPSVRLAAARSLAQRALNVPLKRMLNQLGGLSESMLTQELFERMARSQTSDLVDLVADSQALPRLRSTAIRALAATGDYELISVFVDATRSSNPDVRAAASRGLGQLDHPLAAPVLERLLRDDVWYVRAAAAEAIGKIDLKSLDLELERLMGDHSWWVRFRAAQALAMEGERGQAVLERVAQSGASVARDVAALTLLERKEA